MHADHDGGTAARHGRSGRAGAWVALVMSSAARQRMGAAGRAEEASEQLRGRRLPGREAAARRTRTAPREHWTGLDLAEILRHEPTSACTVRSTSEQRGSVGSGCRRIHECAAGSGASHAADGDEACAATHLLRRLRSPIFMPIVLIWRVCVHRLASGCAIRMRGGGGGSPGCAWPGHGQKRVRMRPHAAPANDVVWEGGFVCLVRRECAQSVHGGDTFLTQPGERWIG